MRQQSHILLCFILLVVAGQFVWAASLSMVAPKAQTVPVIDGHLQPGEWDDAVAVTGVINQFDGLAHPRQATFWMKYDEKYVYVAQRSTLLPGEIAGGVHQPPFWFSDNDNSVVICLSPGRKNSGDLPSHYLLRANISGKTVMSEITGQIAGVNVRYPNPEWAGKPMIANSLSADQTVWESEYAIPLAEMKVEAVGDGESWRALFARDYASLDQNSVVVSHDWRFGPALRHWNLALYNNYTQAADYATVTLRAKTPVIQVLGLGDLPHGQVAPQLAIGNTGADAATVTIGVQVVAPSGEALPAHTARVTVAPGQRREVRIPPVVAGMDKEWSLLLDVHDTAGNVLYQQVVPFRPDYAADRLAAVPDVYFSGAHKEKQFIEATMSVYDPWVNKLIAQLRVNDRPWKAEVARADVAIQRPKETKPFITFPMPDFTMAGVSELHAKLPELTPGLYEATARVYDKTGKVLARASNLFIRYDHARELPWIGNTIGQSTKVLPPWTPITSKAKADNLSLSCWGRTYTVSGSGLLARLQAVGGELLAAPLRLEVMTGGKALPLRASAVPTQVVSAPEQVSFNGELNGPGWRIRTASRLEYDGYLHYRLRLEPQGAQAVERIRLVIPLRPAEATLLHAAAADMRAAVSWVELPAGPGKIWDSGQAVDATYNGKGLTVGNFKPYVWVGGAHRGLAFLADNDQGWVPDETKATSAIAVERTAFSVNLILNLVARPFVMDHPREIAFSLQATPVRPLPDDFRHTRTQYNIQAAFPPVDADGWSSDGQQLMIHEPRSWFVSGGGATPYPINWARNIARAQSLAAQGTWFTPYQAMNGWLSVAEVDDPRVPALQGANFYGYLCNALTGSLEWGDGVLTRADMESRLWRYQRWIKETRMPGLYFDNAYPSLGTNIDIGQGYVLDLPDRPKLHGAIQPGYSLTGMREFLKRLRTIYVEEGLEPRIWIHATDGFMLSCFSFADNLLGGENGPYLTPKNPYFSEKWPPATMQAMHNPQQSGITTSQLVMLGDGFEPWHLSPLTRQVFRDFNGYMRLHDAEPTNFQNMPANGIDLRRPAEFLPYWDPPVHAALRTGEATTLASGWRQDNLLEVLVFNRSADARPAEQLQVDLAGLGLEMPAGTSFIAVDLDQDGAESEIGGAIHTQVDGARMTIDVPLMPHNYRRFLIRPSQEPAAVAGLAAWYRADNGFSGARWLDQSARHLDLAQTDTAQQPVLLPAAMHARPTLRFSAKTPRSLTSTTELELTDTTMMLVYAIGQPNGTQSILKIGNTRYCAVQFGATIGNVNLNNCQGDTGWLPIKMAAGTPQLLTVVQQGSKVTIYRNAQHDPVQIVTLPGTPEKISGPVTIHGQLDWDLAELAIFDRVPSDNDRESLMAYFVARYGIR